MQPFRPGSRTAGATDSSIKVISPTLRGLDIVTEAVSVFRECAIPAAMNAPSPVTITFRIPGAWGHPRELVEGLPRGCRLTPEELILADGTRAEFTPMPPDSQFAGVFRSSCRNPATRDELAKVDGYKVNACLSGPGGSLEAARAMMRAAAEIVRAGGAGVFIDNSGLAHGGQVWLEMTEDGGPDAVSYAFVSVIDAPPNTWTVGLHVLGLRDLLMKREDAANDEFGIADVIRYLARGDKPVEDGHILADLSGPRFRALTEGSDPRTAGTPMYNPFGRLRLVSTRDYVERN